MTIAIMAIIAIAAVKSYNTSKSLSPDGTTSKVSGIRQSLAVVLAVAEAVWSVLDALVSLTKPRSSSNAQPLRSAPAFGTRLASDVEG